MAVPVVRGGTLRDHLVQGAQQGNRQGQGKVLDLLEPTDQTGG